MTTSGTSYGVTNPATRIMKWFKLADFGGSKYECMNAALKYEDKMLSRAVPEGSVKFELQTSRCHTIKPGTDRRFRGNRESKGAGNTQAQIAIN